jgi:hypothetical protein
MVDDAGLLWSLALGLDRGGSSSRGDQGLSIEEAGS